MKTSSHIETKNELITPKITDNADTDNNLSECSEKINANFHDYFKISKEKITKLQTETDFCSQTNSEKEAEIKQLNFKFNELLTYSQELTNRMDEIKEKINTSIKYKEKLQQDYVKILKETNDNKKEIEEFKKKNEYKIKLMNNDTGKNHYRCELNIERIKEMNNSEVEYQKLLIEKIASITKEIDNYENLTKENKFKEINIEKLFDDASKIAKVLKDDK